MLNTVHQADSQQRRQVQDAQRQSSDAAHPTVVIVDTDQAVLQLMEDLLHTEGYTTHSFENYDDYTTASQQLSPDLVILDGHPCRATTLIAMVQQLRRTPGLRTTPIIIDSTDKRLLATVAESSETTGCYTFEKPFDIDVFLQFVEVTLDTPPTCNHAVLQPYTS